MKRKRFRFLMHKPDYPAEVAAEIQACIAPVTASIRNLLTHALLLQSRIRECAVVVKGKALPPISLFPHLTRFSSAVFEDLPTPPGKKKRAARAEDAPCAERPPAERPFDEHSATTAQAAAAAEAPASAETAPPAPATESRAAKSSPRPSTSVILSLLLTARLTPPYPLRPLVSGWRHSKRAAKS